MRFAILFLLAPACFAQSDPYLRNDLSASFRYGVILGNSSYYLGDSAPGFGLKYSYRPLRWLAVEAGYEQIPRTLGGSVCCRFSDNADDELYLVPFGLRYVWEPQGGRIRLSAGGGGAYLNHSIGNTAGELMPASGWGVQAVAAGDYAITRSGRWRAGATVRYYYVPINVLQNVRVVTVGPDFTFSFR